MSSRAVNSILLTTLTFSAVGNCADQCFNQSIVPISPTADLQLPDNNGNLITVIARGPPTLASGRFQSMIFLIRISSYVFLSMLQDPRLLHLHKLLRQVSPHQLTFHQCDSFLCTICLGEPPPGRAAQLGMGLGITFIGLIVIAEIAFLYKKYGFSSSARASDYELRYTQDYDAS